MPIDHVDTIIHLVNQIFDEPITEPCSESKEIWMERTRHYQHNKTNRDVDKW